MMDSATTSDGENVSEIQSLTLRVQHLSQSAEWWNAAMIWGLALAALAAVFVLIATRVVVTRASQLSTAQDELSEAKERTLQADLKEKDRQIADAQRGSAEANERATKAEQSLASAEEHAKEADAKAEGFRLEIAKANESAAKSQERAAQLESNLVKLRKEAEPRRLSGEQKERLARLLAGHPAPIGVVSKMVDTEASDFADDFDEVLKNAHWETLRIKNRISSRYGVSISFVSAAASNSVPELRMLDEALAAIGVPHQIAQFAVGDASISPAFQDRGLYLVVDEKPPVDRADH
jgi:flagellar biosynthesis GTPase FlhF